MGVTIQLKCFIVIIALSVFSEVIFRVIMPSKEVAQRNRRKSKNKAYYEAQKDDILSNKKENYSSEDRSQRHLDEYYKHVRDSRMKSAESTKVSYDKMWRDLVKIELEHATIKI